MGFYTFLAEPDHGYHICRQRLQFCLWTLVHCIRINRVENIQRSWQINQLNKSTDGQIAAAGLDWESKNISASLEWSPWPGQVLEHPLCHQTPEWFWARCFMLSVITSYLMMLWASLDVSSTSEVKILFTNWQRFRSETDNLSNIWEVHITVICIFGISGSLAFSKSKKLLDQGLYVGRSHISVPLVWELIHFSSHIY